MPFFVTSASASARSRVVLGVNTDVDGASASEDIWDDGGNYPFPTSANATTLVSSSANDTVAGTGARIVRVYGLDADYNSIIQDVELNGTSAVTLTTPLIRVQGLRVIAVGSGATNAGDIDIKHTSTVIGTISTGLISSRMGVFTVPAGDTATVLSLYGQLMGTTSANCQIALQAREQGSGWFDVFPMTITSSKGDLSPRMGLESIPEKTDLRIRATGASADNLHVVTHLTLLLR
jgi:hypothetical protein